MKDTLFPYTLQFFAEDDDAGNSDGGDDGQKEPTVEELKSQLEIANNATEIRKGKEKGQGSA